MGQISRIRKCDVISEKEPYCGRNSVFIDQLFLHFCDNIFVSKLHREREKCLLQMFISNKYRRLWSDAAHHARRLIRAYNICSAIRSFFADDVTYFKLEVQFSQVLLHFFPVSKSTSTRTFSQGNYIYIDLGNNASQFLSIQYSNNNKKKRVVIFLVSNQTL